MSEIRSKGIVLFFSQVEFITVFGCGGTDPRRGYPRKTNEAFVEPPVIGPSSRQKVLEVRRGKRAATDKPGVITRTIARRRNPAPEGITDRPRNRAETTGGRSGYREPFRRAHARGRALALLRGRTSALYVSAVLRRGIQYRCRPAVAVGDSDREKDSVVEAIM